jgi:predicted DNA binding protein
MPSKQSEALRKLNPASGRYNVRLKSLNKEKSGDEIIQVSGTWKGLTEGRASHSSKIAAFMKSVGRKRIYIVRSPSFDGGRLRVSLAGDGEAVKRLLQEMTSAEIPFEVSSLSSSRAREESLLADLTERQVQVLRLAHSMGYYDVPKRTGVEEIARLLGKDKGTVGEQLRRAEKHVFDRLLA